MTEQFAIYTRGLSKSFGEQSAVNGVDIEVHTGEIFGLVGPDGAGKTTTMRLLAGILGGGKGDVRVGGHDVFRDPERVKSQIGYMSQRFSLYTDLTVAENLHFFATLYRVSKSDRQERERRLLEFSRLGPFRDRLVQNLSGGMKQKLALSCTLIHTPKILFLDEPTTGVDPVSRREFWQILYMLLKQGVTIFVSTPYMDEAERCNRVAFMNKGRIILCDTPSELKKRMKGRLYEVVSNAPREARTLLEAIPGILGVHVFGDRLHVWVDDDGPNEEVVSDRMISQRIETKSIRQIVPGLEDVFVSTLREESPR